MTSGPVTLRQYAVSDATSLYECAIESMQELGVWMPWCHSGYSMHDARQWIEAEPGFRERGLLYDFVIEHEGKFVGACGLNRIDHFNGCANVGYWLRSSMTGRGIVVAAAKQLCDWAFSHTAMIRLEIVVSVHNTRSLRVAKKLGAAFEGKLSHRIIASGEIHEACLFAIVKPGTVSKRDPSEA